MTSESISQISRIGSLTALESLNKTSITSADDGFGQILSNALDRLNKMEGTANQAATHLAVGEDVEIHQVMLAMQEADIGFQLALQVRNKLVEAYQEIMRMQV